MWTGLRRYASAIFSWRVQLATHGLSAAFHVLILPLALGLPLMAGFDTLATCCYNSWWRIEGWMHAIMNQRPKGTLTN